MKLNKEIHLKPVHLLIIFTLFAAFMVFEWWRTRDPHPMPPGPPPRSQPDNTDYSDDMAIAYAQMVVEENLKAPATAKFRNAHLRKEGKEYTVVGQVDAQNSFGANIRSTYRCRLLRSGESFSLVGLEIVP